jgi:CheY-like chemotaxis protein/two-component sensor histidine kinase
MVRNIDSALESVETILGAVLDISRLDTGAMKPRMASVALSALLQRIETDFAPIAREKRLKLVVMPTTLKVRSDPNLLRRVVQNLVSNAIKYTPTGKVLIGARRRGDKVIIQVMDSGIGIPASKFRTVFKEFARLDEGAKTASGLGLGLSIVDRIARVLDHPVELRSIPGRGTDFRIVMPLDLTQTIETTVPSASVADRAMRSLRGLKILCVDNEPDILEGMQLLMSGWGCEVAVSPSLAALAEMPATDTPPDIVIADYHLGDGTGIDAIGLLRQRYGRDLPALVITADRSPEVRAEAEKHGIGLQQKPVRPAALRAYLAQVSSLKRAAAE